jgi:hypothetical protein
MLNHCVYRGEKAKLFFSGKIVAWSREKPFLTTLPVLVYMLLHLMSQRSKNFDISPEFLKKKKNVKDRRKFNLVTTGKVDK